MNDNTGRSDDEVRAIVRDELGGAVRYLRVTLVACFTFFTGAILLLLSLVLGSSGFVPGLGFLCALFGAATLYGQRSFADQRVMHEERRERNERENSELTE